MNSEPQTPEPPTVDPYLPPKAPGSKPVEEVLDPISGDLRRLLTVADGKAMTLEQIAAQLHERGWALLVLFLAAPFPIPNIPGLSVPFGCAIGFIGWAFMVRRRPWLPQFVMRTSLEYSTLGKVIPFIARFMERVERWTKPRMKWLVSGPVNVSLIGLGILSGGFFLALPLPIPLTNGPPALSIIFLVVGMLCRDGIMLILGYILGVLSWVYLGVWIYFGKFLIFWFSDRWHHITDWFKSLF